MKKVLIVLMVCGMILTFGSFAGAITDVIQSPTSYFIPEGTSVTTSPYYRWYNEDWGWTHNAIGGSITSAILGISAWDVDYSSGERDIIYAWENGVSAWVNLGVLAGNTNIWEYTEFTLGAAFFDDIANGLQVKIDIDSTNSARHWAVTLAKSVLATDGSGFPDPDPGTSVPEPATMLLLGLGLIGLAGLRRKE